MSVSRYRRHHPARRTPRLRVHRRVVGTGTVSGAKTDKSAIFPYHLGEAGMPVIEQSPLVMECEVIDTYEIDGFKNYDVVYVGFPIWWYTCPTIINTFMEAYDFQGKTVIPFATSGGSSIKKACADLKAAYPNLNWKEGKLLNRASKAELQKWVESNR